jgi:hypothetical protein
MPSSGTVAAATCAPLSNTRDAMIAPRTTRPSTSATFQPATVSPSAAMVASWIANASSSVCGLHAAGSASMSLPVRRAATSNSVACATARWSMADVPKVERCAA